MGSTAPFSETEESLDVAAANCAVSTIWMAPKGAIAALVLAHGAGAGLRSSAMSSIAGALARHGFATFRFNFPYMERKQNRVDRPDVAIATITAAVAAARRRSKLPLWLGGHSFGGRMATHTAAELPDLPVRGLVLCSFPLHTEGKPSVKRAEHLPRIKRPMLFLSGTRDGLAQRDLLQNTVDGLGRNATLHWLHDADHGYRVRKRERAGMADVFDEMAAHIAAFVK